MKAAYAALPMLTTCDARPLTSASAAAWTRFDTCVHAPSKPRDPFRVISARNTLTIRTLCSSPSADASGSSSYVHSIRFNSDPPRRRNRLVLVANSSQKCQKLGLTRS